VAGGRDTDRRRVTLRQLGRWYGLGAVILKPLAVAFTSPRWSGLEHVPRQGGVILAANHISHADPIVLADFVLYGAGRPARFLAKSSLFTGNGLVGRVMRGADQIPVHRHTADASLALGAAVEALQNGECIVIYPEGTVTRDRDKWPMVAKTGVARLALLSGAPVVPVGQWGAERILDTYRSRRVDLRPRRHVEVVAGPPVDLSAYRGKELTAEVLRDATDEVMRAVTRLVEELRGERAPARAHDPRPTAQDRRSA
jgi:1-acyl-sn-glycerol-3-phosphate acyltransferase